ncbi:MAG: DUF1667 domain-containing protein [Oscillospiraceae bacterium]
MEIRNLTCIQCPLGCPLAVTLENGKVLSVTGNTCKRGETYGAKEVTAPTRTVTSTVRVLGGVRPVVAVKTRQELPKERIFDCMAEIDRVVLQAPVHIGDIAIENVCGTDVPVIVTADCGGEEK